MKKPLKFILVGIWNTIFGYGIFWITETILSKMVTKYYIAYMSAMIFSNITAIVHAYFLHKFITFRTKGNYLQEFTRFFSVYLLGMLINFILLPVSVEIFFIKAKIAQAGIMVLCAGISYLGHNHFSFKT